MCILFQDKGVQKPFKSIPILKENSSDIKKTFEWYFLNLKGVFTFVLSLA